MQYFVSHGDGVVHGPYSREQLLVFANEGRVTPQTQVRSLAGADWLEASSLIDFGAVAPPPPPPPPPPPAAARTAATATAADTALRILVPIRVEPVSLLAGYLGLFAIVLFPAPLALGVGLWALARLKGRTDVRGAGRAWTAVVLGFFGTLGLIAFVVSRL